MRPLKTNSCQQGEKGRPTAVTRVFERLRLRDFPDSSKEFFSPFSFFIQTPKTVKFSEKRLHQSSRDRVREGKGRQFPMNRRNLD